MGSANALRREISARNLERGGVFAHETTFGDVAQVIYSHDDDGAHGNFLSGSYRRILADPSWRMRLEKVYTAGARVPRRHDRWRGELECANSSDALLMNIFCYPGLVRRKQVCSLLNIDPGLRPEFGVRAHLAMQRGEVDRTEIDMRLGTLLVEAKLTESGFQKATRDRLLRYDAEPVFEIEDLPWRGDEVIGYQLIRGVLAAHAADMRFVLLCDSRRTDLLEIWFQVLRAVRHSDVRSRMAVLHWQEIARVSSAPVRSFLAAKYGIVPA